MTLYETQVWLVIRRVLLRAASVVTTGVSVPPSVLPASATADTECVSILSTSANVIVDRKSVVEGKSVDLGGPRIIKKKGSASLVTWVVSVTSCLAGPPCTSLTA